MNKRRRHFLLGVVLLAALPWIGTQPLSAQALSPPTLSSPANGSTNQPTSVTLRWNAVVGSTDYEVFVSRSAAFSDTVIRRSDVADTTFPLDALALSTTYYWQVRARGVFFTSNWSDTWSFTTTVPAPPSPLLTSPANSTTGTPTTVTVSWNPSGGATSYHLQVSGVSDFSTMVLDHSALGSTQDTVGGLSRGTTYYWRVTASNAGGTSAWSAIWNFRTLDPPPETPILLSPTDASTNQPTAITFSWNASAGASAYRLQLSTNSGFSAPSFDDSTLTGTARSVGPLAATTTYYWRLNSRNADESSPWSPIRSFTTGNPPTARTDSAKVDDAWSAILNGTVTANSDSALAKFNFGTTTSYGGAITAQEGRLRGSTPVPVTGVLRGLTPNTTYHFRVSAFSAVATVSGEDLTFITSPDTFALSSPSNEATDQPLTPTLVWNSAAGATLYHLQVSTSSAFSDGINDSTVTGTSRQIGPLTRLTSYFWRVRARNSGGWSWWSGVWRFTTIPFPPAAPALGSPSNGMTNQQTSLTLSWNAATGSQSYHLQVSTSSAFGSTMVDDPTVTSTSRTVSGLATGTTYFWRVAPINTGGQGNWSTVWSFVTQGSGVTHGIILPQGWNMVSSFVQPQRPELDSLCRKVRSHMVLMKNGGGQVYWPSFQINSIGSWNNPDGYQIFMQTTDTMMVSGPELLPEVSPISMIQGWNMAGYLRNSALAIETALQSISGQLVLVKNNNGQVYWPAFGINQIVTAKPGQGYQIYLSQSGTLTYPANSSSSGSTVLTKQVQKSHAAAGQLQHFVFTTSTGNNSTVAIPASCNPTISGLPLSNGDEIGAFSPDSLCVGAVVWNGSSTALTIWGDNNQSASVDGMRPGEEVQYRVWRQATGKEYGAVRVSYTQGDGIYKPDGVSVMSSFQANATTSVRRNESTPTEYFLDQNYPNPFNSSTVIVFGLPKESYVRMGVYNILGHQVASLVNEKKKAGIHRVVFTTTDVPSGVYFYQMQTDINVQTKKLIIMR